MDEVIGMVGAKAKCAMCGQPITFVGPYWDHDGEIKPRHPATPTPWKTVVNTSNFTESQREELKKIIRAEIIEYMKECLYGNGDVWR